MTAVNDSQDIHIQKLAMKLSFGVGILMLAGKTFAYYLTGSAAILSDAAESVVHVAAVSFAAYSLWVSLRPINKSHLYGYDKITFFSAGFEGAMIVLAALFILYSAIYKWIMGLALHNLDKGTLIVAVAAILNGGLGAYLLLKGKKYHSLILEADGKHVLADCYTSIGVIIGLSLTLWTGWLPFDPLFAILIALNILWTGSKLIRQSIGGLMDEIDHSSADIIKEILARETQQKGITYHGLRHRTTGNTIWIEVHLLFPSNTTIAIAHKMATEIEEELERSMSIRTEVSTHLESIEDHHQIHHKTHFENL